MTFAALFKDQPDRPYPPFNEAALAEASLWWDIVTLWDGSPLHSKWSDDEMDRLVLPPVELGQFLLLHDDEGACAFITWAWLSNEARDGYLTRTRKLQPGDWNSGPECWVIDLIAVRDGLKRLFAFRRTQTDALGHIVNWVRTDERGVVRKIGAWQT